MEQFQGVIMERSKLWPAVQVFRVVAIVLMACSIAGAQSTPAEPVVPVPLKKVPAKRVAKPVPVKQTAEQARAAAVSPATTTAVAPIASALTPTAATASGASAVPRTTQNGSSGAVGTGTLAWGTRVYSSTGCTHNGNSAVCTFTFVNQGNQANLAAGGAGELSGIQLVDDAHVPHRWDAAYFMDKYGAQQRRLIVEPGDTGTYIVVFPNVDPHVASAEFHLRNQVVGGITVGAAGSNAAAAPKTK
jgi:hypothetical protein